MQAANAATACRLQSLRPLLGTRHRSGSGTGVRQHISPAMVQLQPVMPFAAAGPISHERQPIPCPVRQPSTSMDGPAPLRAAALSGKLTLIATAPAVHTLAK